jgi:sn-glycerol 3-phosphate transport system ATP-binding protein
VASIEFRGVVKVYDKKNLVIDDLNLLIEDGSFTVLVGPSGCGKTTALRIIAGLEEVTKGSVLIGDEDVTKKEPGDRDVAMVFQNYAIYPHMTVKENIEFGLVNAKVPKAEREVVVAAVLKQVGLERHVDEKPSKLSGGQRQRVALARAISKKPRVFLMDEPLSNLDAKLRNQMRRELVELHNKLKTTFVFVTHDQIEAMTMGDCIVIMCDGRIRQKGAPQRVYNDPDNVFVARFIGDPGMNVYPMEGGGFFGFRPRKVGFAGSGDNGAGVDASGDDGPADNASGDDAVSWPGRVAAKEILGSEVLYCVKTKLGDVMLKTSSAGRGMDDLATVSVPRKNLVFFDQNEDRVRDENEIRRLAGGRLGA